MLSLQVSKYIKLISAIHHTLIPMNPDFSVEMYPLKPIYFISGLIAFFSLPL